MSEENRARVIESYAKVAADYVERIADELEHKPFDRELLDRFAARFRTGDLVCEVGCGPGQVAAYLHGLGVRVIGIDLSPEMLEHARRLNPGIEFQQGDMLALDVDDGAFAGIVAFYSIIHVPPADVVTALRELGRTLRPGGTLLLSFHIGDGVLHRDEWWGHEVSIDFFFFRPDDMARHLATAGFEVEEIVERDAYPDVEYPSRRAYLLARRRGE